MNIYSNNNHITVCVCVCVLLGGIIVSFIAQRIMNMLTRFSSASPSPEPLRSFQLVLHSTYSFKPSFCKLDVWSIAQWQHKWPQRQGRKRVRWSMRQQNPRRRALLQSAAMDVLLPKKNRTIRVCGSLRCDGQNTKTMRKEHPKKIRGNEITLRSQNQSLQIMHSF